MSTKESGIVKWFNNDKGYGFSVNQSGEDVFIHYRAIMGKGLRHWQKVSRYHSPRLSLKRGGRLLRLKCWKQLRIEGPR